jgi:aryl-alcohol dehydrogenase-like predicted oxidoreductase
VVAVAEIAEEKHCTPAQLALAWVLAQGDHIVPIPGTKRPRYIAENMGALALTLTPADLQRIDSVFPRGAAAGERYSAATLKAINADAASPGRAVT